MSNITKKLILLLSDLIIVLFSLSASYSLRLEKIYFIWEIDYRVTLIYLIVFFFIFYIYNIYRILLRYFDYYSIIRILKSIIVVSAILIPVNFFLQRYLFSQINFFYCSNNYWDFNNFSRFLSTLLSIQKKKKIKILIIF